MKMSAEALAELAKHGVRVEGKTIMLPNGAKYAYRAPDVAPKMAAQLRAISEYAKNWARNLEGDPITGEDGIEYANSDTSELDALVEQLGMIARGDLS